MRTLRPFFTITLKTTLLLATSFLSLGAYAAQAQPAKNPNHPPAAAAAPADPDNAQLATTRKQLIELLVMDPKVASFVKRDPLLLSDQEFVNRNNPRLAEFLQQHPEIARNPEFYLFADIPDAGRGIRDVYIDEPGQRRNNQDVFEALLAFVVFVIITGVLLWLLRVLLENRRWGRVFKVQTEIYNKLLDKFSTNEELLAYIRSESGKRFLDSAALPFETGAQPQISNPVARVLTPLQLGVVLTLVGGGLLYLRNSIPDALTPLLIFGTLSTMAGVGFVLSAVVAFALARHLGLMPTRGVTPDGGLAQQHDIS